MAPRLQDLIDFLLAEIALCGDQGASVSDILAFTGAFYAKAAQDTSEKSHNVDRRFQAKVWSWLTRHPEVSVGKDREGNHLSFDEVGCMPSTQENEKKSSPDDPRSVRVFVSEERTWLAITGHEPDESKVFPTEFPLLSIIASSRSNGISQTDLVRLSGQDKRSVPKRTDRLQANGYIQKRAIQLKSVRTSLCTLCRFLKPEYSDSQAPMDQHTTTQATDRVIDFNAFTDQLFEILKEYEIIARDDLKKLLGFSDHWHWKALSRALRKFERIGVLKRVKAPSQYRDTMKKLHPCVMLLREPSERDLELFHEFSRNIISEMEQKEDGEEPDENFEEEAERMPSSAVNDGTVGIVKREENVEEAGRILPSWTPDRSLYHLLFDTIDAAGTSGVSNSGIVRSCFGGFFRRPLENALGRLAECWQLSQPLHLRHLAIVRDTVLHRTQAMYVHYSAGKFQELVEAGEALWEAVEFSTKRSNIRVPPIGAIPQLDEYGFPIAGPSKELFKNGNATLLECIASCKPADYTRSGSDPVAILLEDGTYAFRTGSRRLPSDLQPRSPKVHTPRGRPKKQRPKEEEDQEPAIVELGDEDHDDTEITEIKRPKKSQRNEDLLKGMSEKEKLEALGMDETWTEYSVLLLQRTDPGVYVTPRGRRRPVGKSRGRPRTSQFAVFKSPKLASFPWFTKEKDDMDEEDEEINAVPSTETPAPAPTPGGTSVQDSGVLTTRSRGSKRNFQERESSEEESAPATDTPSSRRRGRRSKQIRPSYREETETEDVVAVPRSPSHQGAGNHAIDTENHISEQRPKRKRSPSQSRLERDVDVQEPIQGKGGEIQGARSKKHRHESERDLQNGDISVAPTPEDAETGPARPPARLGPLPGTEKGTGDSHTQKREAIIAAPANEQPESATTIDRDKASTVERGQAVAEPSKGTQGVNGQSPQAPKKAGKKGRTDTGGSVALLRRKIILNIIEKAGGAYPMGTEFWYPFTTAWMKTKFKDKPEMRTVRTSVKHLVDAGHLRQLTFSGRDGKGVMVTKNLITKPETAPDDPVVKDMQRQMLAAGAQYYFPPNSEINPELIKSGDVGITKREAKPIAQLPVETGVTVQLQNKPSVILKKERGIQRQLLQTLESEEHPELGRRGRIPRLKTLQRPTAGKSASIAMPGGLGRAPVVEGVLRKAGRVKRIRTMLMKPRQTFHATTGTFGTGAVYTLPESLGALFAQTQRRVTDVGKGKKTVDLPVNQFFKDADEISRWELQNEELFFEKSDKLHYINQTVLDSFDPAPIGGSVRFADDEPVRPAVPREPVTTRATTSKATGGTGRRLNKLEELTTPSQKATTLKQPIRRSRHQALPRSFVQRIMAALVAVRALAGGTEGKMIDWPLVAKCFPGHDPRFIQERAKNILSKDRLQIAKMQVDFQERFIEAYANRQVPAVDYEDLEGYDWAEVVDWAQTQLDVPSSEKLPDLPATRAQFDSVFELREEPPVALDELYQTVHSVTINRKRTLLAGAPFAEPLREKHVGPKSTPQRKVDLERLDVAKTWVRANVVTPEESYQPTEARQALEQFGESLIGEAVQSLVTDRTIRMGKRGRITPGRNYDITDHFLNVLRRRAIESTQLRRAAQFKTTILDPALDAKGVFEVDYNAEDGDILALINLAAEGKVAFRPRDPPRDKYGLTDGGYLTRQMDKQKLRFAVDVYPVKDAYVSGNPIAEKISQLPPPAAITASTGDNTLPKKLPIWIDVHGNFYKLLWDLVAGAVIGCIATRPGMSAREVARMIKPTANAWEIQLMLEWMEAVGAMRRGHRVHHDHDCGSLEEEPGWVAKEWWWMALG